MQLSAIDVIASSLEPLVPDLGRMSSPDGAVTLMLSDIDEAEAAEQRLGPERWAALLRDHRLLVDQVVSHHDGQVVKHERDGMLATFNSAHAGLHCAAELQRTFSAAPRAGAAADAVNSNNGASADLALRMGLHSGFVMTANADQLLGRNVVLAARIAARAAGGEILVSSALKDYTEGDPRLRFELRGEYHFKGVLGEHTVYALDWRARGS